MEHQRHDLRAVRHVLNADPFIGLVGKVQKAGPIGDAILQAADAVDMFLVVSAGTDDIIGHLTQHRPMAAAVERTTGASRSVRTGCTSNRSRMV